MKCPACGHGVLDNDKKCHHCGQEFNAEARPISRQEIENFEGITIESGGSKSGYNDSYESSRSDYTDAGRRENVRPRVYVKHFNSGIWGTLLVGALIIAFIFFVLPTLLLIGLAIAAVWYVLRMFM